MKLPKKSKIFLQLIGGMISAFFLCEIALRILGFTPVNTNTFDAKNLVIFKPNRSFVIKDRCFETTLKSNSLGFHSREYLIPKPPNTYRIVVLGDSFVEAAQVPLDKTFFELLEKKLNEKKGSVQYEVIPIAKSGHGTLMNLLYAREYALRFEPDLIVDAFITNDLQEDMADVEKLSATLTGDRYDVQSLQAPPPPSGNSTLVAFKHFIIEQSRVLEHVWMNLQVLRQHWQKPQGVEQGSNSSLDMSFQVLLDPQSQLAQDVWKKEKQALHTLADFASDHQAKFLLVHLTEGYLLDPAQRMDWEADPARLAVFDSHMLDSQLQGVASSTGFAFYSTQPYFEKQWVLTHEWPSWSCDNHYRDVGHQWVANALFEFFESSGFLAK